jgi:predicted nucleic acid-binding protein
MGGAGGRDHLAVARQRLTEDWASIHIVEVTQALVERAGEFAEGFALRGYDAVQLAAAQVLHAALAERVSFLSFDRRLNRAAVLLGLDVPEGALR